MELESSFKEHEREGKIVRELQEGFLKKLEWGGVGVGGLTGRVLSTLGHGAPEVKRHLFLSHLHAKRRAWWLSVGLK